MSSGLPSPGSRPSLVASASAELGSDQVVPEFWLQNPRHLDDLASIVRPSGPLVYTAVNCRLLTSTRSCADGSEAALPVSHRSAQLLNVDAIGVADMGRQYSYESMRIPRQ